MSDRSRRLRGAIAAVVVACVLTAAVAPAESNRELAQPDAEPAEPTTAVAADASVRSKAAATPVTTDAGEEGN